MLISTSELNSILNDPDIIIADTRSFKEYSEDHIPGSVHLDLFAFHWIDTTKQGIENFNSQARTYYCHFLVLHLKKESSFMILYLECLQQGVFGC